MGCCTIKNSTHSKTSIKTLTKVRDLATQRQDLTSIIFSLHKIILSCNIQIENYLIKKEKHWASLLKCKKFCIQSKQKQLQVLASKMDQCLEDPNPLKYEKKELLIIFDQISLEIQSMPVFDSEVNIDLKDKNYLNKLNNNFNFFQVNFNQFEVEAEVELRSMTSKVIEAGTIRRKFVKSRKSV
jgi:hypothetical protein